MTIAFLDRNGASEDKELSMWNVECGCTGVCRGDLVHLSDYLPFIDESFDATNQPSFVPKSVSTSLLKGKEEDKSDDMYHATLNPSHRSLPRHVTSKVDQTQQVGSDASVVWLGRYPTSFVAGGSKNNTPHVNQSYELSYELSKKNVEMLENKYGGKSRSQWAAATIQRAYRRHSLQRTFNHVMDMNRRRQKLEAPSSSAHMPQGQRGETPAILRLHRYGDIVRTPILPQTPILNDTQRTNRMIVYDSTTPSPIAQIRPPNVRVSVGRQRSVSAERSKTSRTAQTKQRMEITSNHTPRILSNEREVLRPHGHTVYAECPAYSTYSESSVSSPCSDTSYSGSSSIVNCDSPSKVNSYSSVLSPSSRNKPYLVDAGAGAVYATRTDIIHQSPTPNTTTVGPTNHIVSPRPSSSTVGAVNHIVSPRSSISPIWVPRLSKNASPRLSPLSTPRNDHLPTPIHQSQSAPKFGPIIEDSPLKRSELHRKRQYRIALNFFNKKPDRGMQFLIDYGFVEADASAVAKFLLTRRGLSKQMIGEYLGNLQNPFNSAVLDCFVNEVDLHMLDLDVALRKFQAYFRLPGEAQKIERIIEVFSGRFCECNPEYLTQFAQRDTIFVLAFAIIMLNTDLHSPSIKAERRMKLEDFIKNLRGIDDGRDINQSLLVGIYERVTNDEFRFASDHVTQVLKVDRSIVGKKPTLSVPHRRLVCYCRLYEVVDSHKKQSVNAHQREIFLFNDLLVITKVLSRKKNGVTYSYRASHSLVGMQLQHFKNNNYPFGLRIHLSLENKVLLFQARSEEDKMRFMEDLKESIMESDEMEAIRIELELEKQCLTRPLGANSLSNNRAETQRDSGLPDLDQNDQVQLRRGQRALSNSMLELVGQEKPLQLQVPPPQPQARARTPEGGRRASVNSLDSGMSSTASVESRESSPKNCDGVPPSVRPLAPAPLRIPMPPGKSIPPNLQNASVTSDV